MSEVEKEIKDIDVVVPSDDKSKSVQVIPKKIEES